MKTPFASAVIVTFVAAAAHAATIRVPEDFPSLLVAVDSSAAGDSIVVGAGTWTDRETRTVGSGSFTACAFITKSITIVGASRDLTIFDAGDSTRRDVLFVNQSPSGTLTLDGITLTGAGSNGYAARAHRGYALTMRNCRVSQSRMGVNASTAFVRDCEFVDNSGSNDRGISASRLDIADCEFRNNGRAASGSDSSHVVNCHFEGNGVALSTGGEVTQCVFESNATALSGSYYSAHDCLFDSNGTGVSGSHALVYDCVFVGTLRAAAMSTGSEFRDNLVRDVVGGQPSYAAGVISGNTFTRIEGGCISFGGITSEIRNNTFYDIQGSAITVVQHSTPTALATIERNVIVGVTAGHAIDVHTMPNLPHSFVEVGCNVLWDNESDHSDAPGASDIFADPQFCDAASMDFRVPEGSLLTAEGNPLCGAIGAYPAGCPLTTHAVYTLGGFPITVDGVEYDGTAASLDWAPGTSHEVSIAVDLERADGRGYVFESWGDGGAPTHTVVATTPPFNLFADVALKFRVDMSGDGNGEVSPGTAWYPLYSSVSIDAEGTPPFSFKQWVGQGFGSYSGTATPANIEVREPLSQHAMFHRKYTMTMIADFGGFVLPGTNEYFPGTQVTIHGYAHNSYHEFTDWVGEGPGSYTGTAQSPVITMQASDIVQTAYFESTNSFEQLTMLADPGGTVTPESGPYPAGEPVTIAAHADPGFEFLGWAGVGLGSYAGPDSVASVLMLNPILERAVFAPEGMSYEFSISASDTDPYVLTDEPTGAVRNLYLWANCAAFGMAAFEGDAAGTLTPLTFLPSDGVYNLAADGDLLLVVGGCPSEGPFLLGCWTVLDTGGTFCLEPSAANGFLGPLDCSVFTPFLFQNAGILGFSSSGEAPCAIGTGSCTEQPTALFFSQFRAQPDDRSVVLSWYAPGSTRATDFVVHRGSSAGTDLVPLMGEIVPIEGGFRLVDTDVVANEAYAYRLFALGREWSPTALVSTPNWAPLVTGFARLGPNPFRATTDIAFALKEPARTRLAIYDVQGRLVTSLIDDALPYGEHTATWNGRTARGYAPAGVYFVRLDAGTVTQTRKIVYLAGPR